MSYIEKRKIKEKTQVYYTKKLNILGKNKVIKKYVGSENPLFSKNKFILDNLNKLIDEEFVFKSQFLHLIDKNSYPTSELSKKIELKSIKINNLIDGKNCENEIEQEFAKEFIFNSNNIEGSKIPPEKVREIISKGTTKYENNNEIVEVQNSILAYQYIKKSFKFNISSIKRVYYILTNKLYRDGNQPYPKGFKKEENIVGNSKTTSPNKVEEELKNLLIWYKKNKKIMHPLILAFEFHAKYEKIHPFTDGNGRTGRLIMNKILISAKYPPIIVFKSNKSSYYTSLESYSNQNMKKYFQFMLEQTNKTYDYFLEQLTKY
jgi:Fic family protein